MNSSLRFSVPLMAAAAALILSINACSKSSTTSAPTISVPDVRPPVQASLASSLLTGGTYTLASMTSAQPLTVDYTTTCQTDATAGDPCSDNTLTSQQKIRCIMKQRLFCTGPTEVLKILSSVDSRLNEIEARSTGTVACASATAIDSTSDITLPGSATFTHHLQCKDSTIKVAWGKKDDIWYLRTGNGSMGGVYSITAADLVNGYFWLPSADTSFSQSTGFFRIKADRAAGTVELTGGGGGIGFCSFHYISNATYIYLIANPNGTGYNCDFTGNSTTDSSDWVETCVNASDLSEATLANCNTLKSAITAPTLGLAAVTSSTSQAWQAAAAAPAGITLQTFDMGTFLNTLHTATGTFQSTVGEFTVEVTQQ